MRIFRLAGLWTAAAGGLLAAAVHANVEDRPDFLLDKGRYKEAYDVCIAKASGSTALDQMVGSSCLGRIYRHGYGFERDYPRAIAWLRKSHEFARQAYGPDKKAGNSTYPLFLIGQMYYEGHASLPADKAVAFSYFNSAVAEAQRNNLDHPGGGDVGYYLGYMHEVGEATTASPTVARSWYARCAQSGHVPCMLAYARFLESGKGGSTNRTEAVGWYRKAAAAGSPEARQHVDRLSRAAEDELLRK